MQYSCQTWNCCGEEPDCWGKSFGIFPPQLQGITLHILSTVLPSHRGLNPHPMLWILSIRSTAALLWATCLQKKEILETGIVFFLITFCINFFPNQDNYKVNHSPINWLLFSPKDTLGSRWAENVLLQSWRFQCCVSETTFNFWRFKKKKRKKKKQGKELNAHSFLKKESSFYYQQLVGKYLRQSKLLALY